MDVKILTDELLSPPDVEIDKKLLKSTRSFYFEIDRSFYFEIDKKLLLRRRSTVPYMYTYTHRRRRAHSKSIRLTKHEHDELTVDQMRIVEQTRHTEKSRTVVDKLSGELMGVSSAHRDDLTTSSPLYTTTKEIEKDSRRNLRRCKSSLEIDEQRTSSSVPRLRLRRCKNLLRLRRCKNPLKNPLISPRTNSVTSM